MAIFVLASFVVEEDFRLGRPSSDFGSVSWPQQIWKAFTVKTKPSNISNRISSSRTVVVDVDSPSVVCVPEANATTHSPEVFKRSISLSSRCQHSVRSCVVCVQSKKKQQRRVYVCVSVCIKSKRNNKKNSISHR